MSLCWVLGEAGEAPEPPEEDLEEGEDLAHYITLYNTLHITLYIYLSHGDPDPELDISLAHEPELLMCTL